MKFTKPAALALGAMFAALAMSAANADTAKAPSPAMTPKPKPTGGFTFSGVARAYQFDRQNVTGNSQSSTNFGIGLHTDYTFGATGFSVGAGYYGADPFGTNGLHPERLGSNGTKGLVDNTLPGASLSTFDETYLRYKSSRFTTTLGNQLINEKWAPAVDTRLKPIAYQGVSASYLVAPNLTVGVDRMIRFEGRTASTFTRNTLLTSSVLGGSPHPEIATSGFLLANLKYATPFVTALAEDYSFYDLANLQYFEARANLLAKGAKPYVAVQYVGENQTGRAVVGVIHNHTYGVQLGANVTKNLLANVSYDGSPTETTTGKSGVFNLTDGSYGSIASPYSDGYAGDPLFTTSLTTGIVEQKATRSYKGGLYYTSDNKRLQVYATRTYFENIGFNVKNTAYESDGDVTYFFSPVGKGTYKGLSLRERYGVRNQPFVPAKIATFNPSFQYVRSQIQYSF